MVAEILRLACVKLPVIEGSSKLMSAVWLCPFAVKVEDVAPSDWFVLIAFAVLLKFVLEVTALGLNLYVLFSIPK